MRHERLLLPISEGEPCGPDLDELGDPEFSNYVGAAEISIPDSFFSRREDEEARAVDLDVEIQSIDKLLGRSRHLRLLILEARLQAFYGSLEGFSDVVSAMAALLERYWVDMHPHVEGEDFSRRATLVRSLEDPKRIVIPLQHRVLLRDRRLGPFSMRQELVASGAVPPRPEEERGDPETIRKRLRDADNFEAIQTNHRAVMNAGEALGKLRALFVEKVGYKGAPAFDKLSEFLKKTRDFLEEVRPDLAGALSSPLLADVEAEAASEGKRGGADGPLSSADLPRVAGNGAAIPNRSAAAAALAAAEEYFLKHEPTAAALILVHKARDLMGRPLVEAISALMPDVADGMAITFKGHPALQIGMEQMRTITESAFSQVGSADGNPDEKIDHPPAATRAEVANLLAGVEIFLRDADPASAAPILLKRAREWIGRDFVAIVGEMLPLDH